MKIKNDYKKEFFDIIKEYEKKLKFFGVLDKTLRTKTGAKNRGGKI